MLDLFWFLATFLVCTIVFTVAELVVSLVLHGRLLRIAGEHSNIIEPIDPVTLVFPVGEAKFTAPISKENVTILEAAYSGLAPKLRLAGLVAALLSVSFLYGGLVLLKPSSWVPFISLLTLPIVGFAFSGLRGFRQDKLKFGEIYAFLNQLYIGGFTTVSFVVIILVLILRYLRVLP